MGDGYVEDAMNTEWRQDDAWPSSGARGSVVEVWRLHDADSDDADLEQPIGYPVFWYATDQKIWLWNTYGEMYGGPVPIADACTTLDERKAWVIAQWRISSS